MLRLAVIIMVAVTLPVVTAARTKQYDKMLANLSKRCEDGVAQACYDYGKTLSASKDQKQKRAGAKFIRRACTLAYAPACAPRSTAAVAKIVKQDKGCEILDLAQSITLSNARAVTQIKPGSIWEKSGFRVGDIITLVDDSPDATVEDVKRAMATVGASIISVKRGPDSLSLILLCGML